MSSLYFNAPVTARTLLLSILLFSFTYDSLGNSTKSTLTHEMFSDEEYTLNGIVRDGKTGEGLAGAHVFLLESTVGTVTDEKGHFLLSDLPAGEYKVGVSMIGFRPYTLSVDVATVTDQSFDIDLNPQVYELDQVMVTGKRNRRWKKQLEQFKIQVIGDTDNAQHTDIVNPEVLNFVQRKNILIAEAHVPLIIENKATGYRIHYMLVHCAIQHGLPQYKGIARFEEMEPKNDKQLRRWKKNRKQAYAGSFKHLLRTLAEKKSMAEVNKEGFYIARVAEFPENIQAYEQAIFKSKDTVDQIVEEKSDGPENLLRVNDFLLITYERELESYRFVRNHMMQHRNPDVQRSSIELRSDSTVFNDKGILYEAYDVVLHGYMGWERMAEMLPLDYIPEEG